MLRKTAVAGGALAAASLATSALLSAILTGHRSEQESDAAALHFVAKPAAWFIPAGRFSGLLVSGIAGARLGGRPR